MAQFCTNCGKEIPDGMAFCTECGTKVEAEAAHTQSAGRADTEPKKDSKYAVMGTGSYLLTSLLFAIPVVGWIYCLKTALTAKNANRRNFARANLILLLIGLAISFMIYMAGKWVVDAILAYVNEAAAGMSGELGGIGEGLSSLGDLMDLLKQFQ